MRDVTLAEKPANGNASDAIGRLLLELRVFLMFFIAGLVAALLVVGCRQSSEPVGDRPTEAELLGTWTLVNAPRGPAGSPRLPKSKNSSFLLSSNNIARLTGVLIEEDTFRDGKPPVIQWRQKTCSGSWEIDQWLRAHDAPLWRVHITVEGNQEMLLQINNRHHGNLELRYRPDPEMAEPFIFLKMSQPRRTDASTQSDLHFDLYVK